MSDAVQTTLTDAVGLIRICRPDRRNALDTHAAQALAAGLAQLSADQPCRAIVLTGGNEAFCAGWDTREFASLSTLPDGALAAAFAGNFQMLERLSTCPKPTIAGIAGPVMGFGYSLACRCDIALAREDASFALPELAYGLVPGMVMQDAVDTMGRRAALDWMLSAETFTARTALDFGVVTRLTDRPDVVTEALGVARRIAGFAAQPTLETKELARRMSRHEATAG